MRRALCMIDPTVEEVGLRRMPVAVAVASLTAVAGLLAVTTAFANGGAGTRAANTERGWWGGATPRRPSRTCWQLQAIWADGWTAGTLRPAGWIGA